MLDWIKDAACRDQPPEWWDTDRGGHRIVHAQAIAICKTCPVKADCLHYAMENERYGCQGAAHARFGIYGGLLPIDRDRLAYRKRRAFA
jgi:WhiB family transcriptional regulator, redox-sensing transcriptional regulator